MDEFGSRKDWLINCLGFVVGIYLGKFLCLHNISITKLLHIVGLVYNLLSVLILSYFFPFSERSKYFITKWGVSIAIAIGGFFWFGFYFGIALLNIHSAWATLAFKTFLPIGILAQFSMMFLDLPFQPPFYPRFKSIDVRVKILGFYYLCGGLCIQLYAELLDL